MLREIISLAIGLATFQPEMTLDSSEHNFNVGERVVAVVTNCPNNNNAGCLVLRYSGDVKSYLAYITIARNDLDIRENPYHPAIDNTKLLRIVEKIKINKDLLYNYWETGRVTKSQIIEALNR